MALGRLGYAHLAALDFLLTPMGCTLTGYTIEEFAFECNLYDSRIHYR